MPTRPPGALALTADLVARAHPSPLVEAPGGAAAMPLAGEAELAAGLAATLAGKPGPADALWVFAYGSLIWRPDFAPAEQRVATLRGWHRRFCLWQWRFRATRERPGFMLALDRGGSCRGIAYRLAGPDLAAALAPVWRREMRGRGYVARWLPVATPQGPVAALAFLADRAGPRYAGRLGDPEIAARIADALGHAGSGAEYLLNTVAALDALGLRDRHLWSLQALVAARLAARLAAPSPQGCGPPP